MVLIDVQDANKKGNFGDVIFGPADNLNWKGTRNGPDQSLFWVNNNSKFQG